MISPGGVYHMMAPNVVDRRRSGEFLCVVVLHRFFQLKKEVVFIDDVDDEGRRPLAMPLFC